MQTVYCISGLGADKDAFQYLDLSFVQPVFVHWISPLSNEALSSYAKRLSKNFIHDSNAVILGLSLGGMIAVELSKLNPSTKAIIISSAKTINEIPFYWRILKYFPIYKFLPQQLVRQNSFIRNYFLGAKSISAKKYIKHVAKHADINFYRWAIGAIVTWKNKTVPLNVIHIHGARDKLLPCAFIKSNIKIENGGHLMIIENAKEISEVLKRYLHQSTF